MGNENEQDWNFVTNRNQRRREHNLPKIDIATNGRQHMEKDVTQTSYFFSDFPESFGAKAMYNIFQKYGDIVEVVIPAKRDKGGRRFGFARFENVYDVRRFEYELDGIIIGRDKISVNISRFQRSERHLDHNKKEMFNKDYGEKRDGQYNGKNGAHNHAASNRGEPRSYAHAVKKNTQGINNARPINQGLRRVSYQAESVDLKKLKGAFVGIVDKPGMSYNIQEQFHRQGYFGIKITPLGANMVLMEEQEEGELQALLLEAKSWLDQWFSQVKPWEPELVDNERLLWVRVYGIPAHAWHVNFFDLICKPYGTFINADDGTTKKNTMDVARLLMRRKGQRVVDDSFEAIVNGVVFPIRIVEDSYGPMRIVLPANDHHEGRVVSDDNSDEEDGLVNTEAAIFMEDQQAHDVEDREFDRESVQSMALIEFENSKGIRIIEDNTVLEGTQVEEEIVETVMSSHNMLLSKEDLFFTNVERIANNDEPPLHRTVLSSTGNMAENRGAFSDSELLGEVGHKKPKSLLKKSVVSAVPKRGANTSTVSKHAPESLKERPLYHNNNNNNSASKIHNNLVASNNMGLSKTVISNNTSSNALSGAVTIHDKPVTCVRNPIGRVKKPKVAATNSISSAGAVLCCSSIQSSDIRNCNKQILKRRDNDVTSKIWKGAKVLGIGEGADEDECTRRIHNNEKRDEEGRNRRVQQKKVNK